MHQAQLPAAYPRERIPRPWVLWGQRQERGAPRGRLRGQDPESVKPVDIFVEEVSKFELIIDLREARALGLEVPMELLVRADEVIR